MVVRSVDERMPFISQPLEPACIEITVLIEQIGAELVYDHEHDEPGRLELAAGASFSGVEAHATAPTPQSVRPASAAILFSFI